MKKISLSALVALFALPAFAAEPTFMCGGTEPFWDLKIHPKGIKFRIGTDPGQIKLAAVQPKAAAGFAIEALRVYNTVTEKKEKVTILIKAAKGCSDGMSDATYSHEAFYINSSTGDVYGGCCNLFQ
jgi:uncharacterized membrane protein